jgi:hypothetical protein
MELNARRKDSSPAGYFYLKPDLIYFLLTVLLSGLAYRLTLCPSVEYIDSGELALACKNLGIAHPTGYPLYTTLGRIATFLFPGELIFKMNMMSLIFTSLASGFLFLCIAEFKSMLGIKSPWGNFTSLAIALFGSLTPIWWSQGTTNEVYSLNLLLISISLYTLLKYFGNDSIKWLMIASFTMGLALTNHLSAAYILPAYLILLIYRWRKRKLKTGVLYFCAVSFLFPLTIYIFLPIRAGFSPFLNWGGVDDPYFLYKHISGWQYRIWMFTDFSLSTFIDKMISSVSLIYDQFGWPGFLLAAVGMIVALARKSYLAVFAVLIIVLNFIYAANYEIIDIESYYLPMITILSIFMGIGAAYLIQKIITATKKNPLIKYVMLAGIIILPIYGFIENIHVSDRSSRTFARQGVMDMIDSMEPGGLAFVENWDFYSPWLYFHFEDNLRKDIVLLDKELMRRSWYIDFIKRMHPEIYEHSASAIEDFLREVEPFERSLPFEAAVIDKAYYNMLHTITINEMTNRPVYTNILIDKKYTGILPLIPAGILFKIDTTGEFYETTRFDFKRELWGNRLIYREKRIVAVLSYYKNAFSAREKYCRYFGKADEAEYYKKMTAEVSAVIMEIASKN